MHFAWSFQDLWHVVVGGSCLQSPELVGAELTAKLPQFKSLLEHFKPYSESTANEYKKNHSSSTNLSLLLRLSKLLDLNISQCKDILEQFQKFHYYGSNNQFEKLLKDERNIPLLMTQAADYYFIERIHMLRTVKYIIGYFEDKSHPLSNQFEEFLKTLVTGNLSDIIQKQYETLSNSSTTIGYKTRGTDCTQQVANHFNLQRMKEQCELLDVLLVYYSHYSMPASTLKELAKLFTDSRFGSMQNSLDPALESTLSALQQLIILQGMEMDYLQKVAEQDDLMNYQIKKNEGLFLSIDGNMCSIADTSKCSILLLAWATVRYHLKMDAEVTLKMGQNAVKFKVWQKITEIFSMHPFNNESLTSSCARNIVHGLISCVLFTLDENSLGVYGDLIHAASIAVNSPKNAKVFWASQTKYNNAGLLSSVVTLFPLVREPMFKLFKALCCDSKSSLLVYDTMKHLQSVSEFVYACGRDAIENGDDPSQWKLQQPRNIEFASGAHSVLVPASTIGQLVDTQFGEIIQWHHQINIWQILHAEVQQTLKHRSSSNIIWMDNFRDVVQTYEIIEDMLKHVCNAEECMKKRIQQTVTPLIDAIFPLLQTITPHKDMQGFVGSLLNCLTYHMQMCNTHSVFVQVLETLQHIQFIPEFDRMAAVNLATLSNQDARIEFAITSQIVPGRCADWLEEVEKQNGVYRTTTALLTLISTYSVHMMKDADKTDMNCEGILACVLYVTKHIFTHYNEWNHAGVVMCQNIGLRCLEIFHCVLRTYSVAQSASEETSDISSMQDMLFGLLSHTQAADVLLKIVNVPVQNIHFLLFTEPTSKYVEDLVQLVQLGFSVINNLLRLTAEVKNESMIPHLLDILTMNRSSLAQETNIISVIATYLYHRYNVALPRLAIILLRRISLVAPMSLHASLGANVDAVRDILLERIRSRIEDLPLKVAILDFLTVSVETQPGLVELFLDLEPIDKEQLSKGLKLGNKSCLSAAFDLIHPDYQGTYEVPPDLHCACVKLLSSLWVDRRHSTLQALKSYKSHSKESLWNSLVFPLFSENSPRDIAMSQLLETCAHIINILALESYYSNPQNRDKALHDLMVAFKTKKRYEHWSKVLVCTCRSLTGKSGPQVKLSLMFIAAWRAFLTTTKIDNAGLRSLLMGDVITSLQCVIKESSSSHGTCSNLLSNLLLIMINHTPKIEFAEKKKVSTLFSQILGCLDETFNESQTVSRLQVHLHSCLLHLLSHLDNEILNVHQDINKLLQLTCTNLQIAIFSLQKEDNLKDKVKSSSILLQTVSDIYAVTNKDKALSNWRKILVGEATFNLLCSVLVQLMRDCHLANSKSRLQAKLARGILLLFCHVAEDKQISMTIRHTGIMEEFCLKSLSMYTHPEESNKKHWLEVYQISLVFMDRMLRSLSFEFLPHSIDFVSVHQDRFIDCLQAVQMQQSDSVLREAAYTTAIFATLSSKYVRQWRFKMPHTFKFITEVCGKLVHSCTAILLRPHLLQKAIEYSNKKEDPDKYFMPFSQTHAGVSKQTSASVNTANIVLKGAEFLSAQLNFMAIVANCLTLYRNLSPNLSNIFLDHGMDLDDYPALLSVGFSTPSLDMVSLPSFGTVLNSANLAQRILRHEHSSNILKSVALLTFDSALTLSLSQCLVLLKNPEVSHREKIRLRRELGDELNSLVRGSTRAHRHSSSGGGTITSSPQASPAKGTKPGPQSDQQTKAMLELVDTFVKQVLR